MKKIVFTGLFFLCLGYVNGQDKEESLFLSDSRYSEGIEDKLLELLKADGAKSVSALQIAAGQLIDDQPITYHLPKQEKVNELTAAAIYDQKRAAVLILGRLNNKGENAAAYADPIATAFAISEDGVCITNRHVLAELLSSISPQAEDASDRSTYYVQNVEGEVFLIDEFLAYSSSNDLCIFKINTRGKNIPFLSLGGVAKVGSPVYVLAHPKQDYYMFTDGIVAKNSKLENSADPKQVQWRMIITADYAVGSSGGPILDNKGQLAGIVSSTINIYGNPTTQQPFQMVVKNAISVLAIKKLLKEGK